MFNILIGEPLQLEIRNLDPVGNEIDAKDPNFVVAVAAYHRLGAGSRGVVYKVQFVRESLVV